jgi:hypothetical protein
MVAKRRYQSIGITQVGRQLMQEFLFIDAIG